MDLIKDQIDRDAELMRSRLQDLEDHARSCSAYRDAVPCADCKAWFGAKAAVLRVWQNPVRGGA